MSKQDPTPLARLFELLQRKDSGKVGTCAARMDTEKEADANNFRILKFAPVEATVCEKAEGDDDDTLKIDFDISSEAIDRDDDTIALKGWKLANFKKNPVVLWAHNGGQPPIGRATATKVDKERARLVSTAEFTSEDLNPFGAMIGRMVAAKFIKTASVGFRPIEFEFDEDRSFWAVDFIKQELLEWSIVPVPSNPEALGHAKAAGIDIGPLVGWAENVLDEEGSSLLIPRSHIDACRKEANGGRVVVLVRSDGLEMETEGETVDVIDHVEAVTETETETAPVDPIEDPEVTEPAPDADPETGTDDPDCPLCARGELLIDGEHVVGKGEHARTFACLKARPAPPDAEPAPDSEPEPADPPPPADAVEGDKDAEGCNNDSEMDADALADAVQKGLAGGMADYRAGITGQLPDF